MLLTMLTATRTRLSRGMSLLEYFKQRGLREVGMVERSASTPDSFWEASHYPTSAALGTDLFTRRGFSTTEWTLEQIGKQRIPELCARLRGLINDLLVPHSEVSRRLRPINAVRDKFLIRHSVKVSRWAIALFLPILDKILNMIVSLVLSIVIWW